MFPKVPCAQTQRIVIFNDRIKISSKTLKVGLREKMDERHGCQYFYCDIHDGEIEIIRLLT